MQITEEQQSGRYIITGYGQGFIAVNETPYNHSLIISPLELVTDWGVSQPDELSFSSLGKVDQWKPEIVLIGTGERQVFPDSDLLYQFLKQGIGCEVMDSAAACRTYNILLTESRNVAAALLLP